ncbi:hypothetical protein CSA56_13000 [candidate division KSB3 bacterium]|uniref:Uncharacterized protein n=1 Tax=candidate division KSB3 bacterium TaxID=2044937 RepID=A0A2G6KBL8_9BACT|nr:MAG: hypothetical protein CSA56_13000 [candidate division KSB3 bacterium]
MREFSTFNITVETYLTHLSRDNLPYPSKNYDFTSSEDFFFIQVPSLKKGERHLLNVMRFEKQNFKRRISALLAHSLLKLSFDDDVSNQKEPNRRKVIPVLDLNIMNHIDEK